MAKPVYTEPTVKPVERSSQSKQRNQVKSSKTKDGNIIYVRFDGTVVDMPTPAQSSSIIRGASVFPPPNPRDSKP